MTHDKFVSLNEAYSVLSRPDLRRTYDLGLPKERGGSRERSFSSSSSGSYSGAVNFRERTEAYGYPHTDQDYYKRNKDHVYIAWGCVVVIILGFASRFFMAV